MKKHALLLLALLPLAAFAAPESAQPPATELKFPLGLAWAPDGGIFISERGGHRVMLLDPDNGEIRRYAGTGEGGFTGDDGPANAAELHCPDAIASDAAGNLYIADRCNERIRRVDWQSGIITTVAGNGERAYSGDGGALNRALAGPYYVRVVDADTLLFTDTDTHRVRQLDLANSRITTLAGNGEGGFAGDGGPALAAQLQRPHVALYASNGDLIIGDSMNQRIRRVDAKTGFIVTIAGNGGEAAAIEGPADESPFYYFGEIHERPNGDLWFTEWGTGRLLALDVQTGNIRVLAGSTDKAANDGTPLGTHFGPTADFLIDDKGRAIIANARQGVIRRVNLETGKVEILTGTRSE